MSLLGNISGAIGGLLGGGVGGLSGGLAGEGSLDAAQMMQRSQEMQMKNLLFQQQMDAISQQYSSLSAAEKAMHESIMQMLNSVK